MPKHPMYRGLIKFTVPEPEILMFRCMECEIQHVFQDHGDGIDAANVKSFIDSHIRTCRDSFIEKNALHWYQNHPR